LQLSVINSRLGFAIISGGGEIAEIKKNHYQPQAIHHHPQATHHHPPSNPLAAEAFCEGGTSKNATIMHRFIQANS